MNFFNMIPVIGWLIAAIISFFVAIPVWFLWNSLAPTYFYWLPTIYHQLPFLHVVGLIWLITSIRGIFLPTFSSSSSSESKSVGREAGVPYDR